MRIYAERRPNEFQEQHFPVHPNEALRRCHPGPLTTPLDHTSITYTPYRYGTQNVHTTEIHP